MSKLKIALHKLDQCDGNGFNFSDILTNPGRKAFIIGTVLALVNQFCGCFAILNYTANIFQEAGSNMSPNMSAIVVGSIQFLGSVVATSLVDRTGRKVNVFHIHDTLLNSFTIFFSPVFIRFINVRNRYILTMKI